MREMLVYLFPSLFLAKAQSGNVCLPLPKTIGSIDQISPTASALAGMVRMLC